MPICGYLKENFRRIGHSKIEEMLQINVQEFTKLSNFYKTINCT